MFKMTLRSDTRNMNKNSRLEETTLETMIKEIEIQNKEWFLDLTENSDIVLQTKSFYHNDYISIWALSFNSDFEVLEKIECETKKIELLKKQVEELEKKLTDKEIEIKLKDSALSGAREILEQYWELESNSKNDIRKLSEQRIELNNLNTLCEKLRTVVSQKNAEIDRLKNELRLFREEEYQGSGNDEE